MTDQEKEWYTQQELAEMWDVKLQQVQKHVGALSAAGVINVTRNPRDKREYLVHKSALDILRKALVGDTGTATA